MRSSTALCSWHRSIENNVSLYEPLAVVGIHCFINAPQQIVMLNVKKNVLKDMHNNNVGNSICIIRRFEYC